MKRAAKTATARTETLGIVEVLRELLKRGDDDAIIELVTKLMSTHQKQLQELLSRTRRVNKSEGLNSAQLSLLVDEMKKIERTSTSDADAKLEVQAPAPPAPDGPVLGPKRRPPRRRPIPEDLPRVDNPIAVPADQRACPVCKKDRVCIGYVTTEIIDIIPMKVIVRCDRREKCACKDCEGQVITAPLGDKVIDGGMYGSQLVADMLVSKYADGLPLHRQHERYERIGLDIPTSTMGDQIAWSTELLEPIAKRLFDEVIGAHTMHLDATSLPVLDRDDPAGIKIGALWGYVGVDDGQRRAAFVYMPSGHKKLENTTYIGPEDALEMRRKRKRPFVVADADGRFEASFDKPGLVEIGCNMHARRYFVKALDAGDARAARPLAAFKKLYDIEERVKDASRAEKRTARKNESRPLYEELLAWCATYKRHEPPTSKLADAVRYLTNHHIALMRFLDDPTLPIDNGIVERLHRKPAQGRKSYLFAGSDAGAARAAIAYSVLGTCSLLGINPIEYVADVLPRLARGLMTSELDALMPTAWVEARTRLQRAA